MLADQQISTRTYNCLRNAGYKTAEEIAATNPWQLLRLKNFGRRCMYDCALMLLETNVAGVPFLAVGWKDVFARMDDDYRVKHNAKGLRK